MSIQPPAAAALADAAHIQVLLVGIGHYPHLAGSDLMGTQGDLELWHGLLNRMGIPKENMWLAASPIDDPAEEAQTVQQLLSALPPGQVCKDGTLAGIQALVKAFVARLGDATSKADRALVFWAGHGYAAPDGTLSLATADTAEVGGGPLQSGGSFTGLLAWNDLADLLDQRPQSVNLTLVVDTCFAAAGPGHRSLTKKTPNGRRPELRAARDADVVLSSSLGGQQALEVGMHKLQVGAFTWAITCVLGRWGQSQQQAGMDISLNSLVARAGALLFAADIDQTPVFDGPVDQGQRPFLHPPGDLQVGDSEPQRLPGSEVDPGHDGKVYQYTDGTLTRLMISTPSTPASGFSAIGANCLYWEKSLPNATFTLAASSSSPPTSLPSESVRYSSAAWSEKAKATSELPASTGTGYWSTGDGFVYYHYQSLVFARSSNADFTTNTTFTWNTGSLPSGGSYYHAKCSKM